MKYVHEYLLDRTADSPKNRRAISLLGAHPVSVTVGGGLPTIFSWAPDIFVNWMLFYMDSTVRKKRKYREPPETYFQVLGSGSSSKKNGKGVLDCLKGATVFLECLRYVSILLQLWMSRQFPNNSQVQDYCTSPFGLGLG